MKLKAVEVLQVLVVVKAIKDGKLDGNLVVEQFFTTTIEHFVEGTPEVLDVIKELVKDIDGGFLGGYANSILKKFAVKEESDEDTNES